MNLFPLGLISAASSNGTIESVSYSMFEPNKMCKSSPVFNILTTVFQDQTMLSRKKSEPFLKTTYEYDDIWNYEYRQIEHFIDAIGEDALNSFYMVAWDRGITPSGVANSGGDWIVSVDNTRFFSSIQHQKSNRGLLWDGLNWKEGQVLSVSANTSVTLNIDALNYGNLSLASAVSSGVLYPMYEVRMGPNALSNFKSTVFVPNIDIDTDSRGGWMFSGSIVFMSKFKV